MKNIFFAFLFLLLIAPVITVNSNILNVPGTYSTIQSAINASSTGDTVLVAPGTYFENIIFRGKGVLLTSNFILNRDTSFISRTIINGSTPLIPDSASTLIITRPNLSYANDSSVTVMGFTITGGKGVVWDDVLFPGYFYREGGGILIQYCSPRIRFNRIIENTIYDSYHPDGGGGGIHFGGGNPIIENNIIQNNFGYCGMGICIYGTGGIVRNNIISGNYGGQVYGSGAVYTFSNYNSIPVIIENNTIVKNSSIVGSAGLRLYNSNYNYARNNIIWGNIPSQMSVSGCNPTVTYNDIDGGWSGTGNINLNPQFIGNSFYLNSSSPCKDAGDPGNAYNDPQDPQHTGYALFPALGTIRNDMGAFGGPHCSILGTPLISIKNINSPVVSDYHLFQNYPNPFNPATKIVFQIPKSDFVMLDVYDISGRLVQTLFTGNLKQGKYEIEFDGSTYSSGVYVYKLFTTNFTQSEKMILVK
jgi:hypothetical protein